MPQATISGRALVAVVAIMTFLASLTTGAVMLVRAAANEWQAEVAREVTIQVRPAAGRDIEADIAKAAAIARAASGVAEVRPYSKEEAARLLEPWLGTGLPLDDLPVPRIIVVRIAPGAAPDLAQLRQTLGEQVPAASLDDHRGFVDRMRAMSGAALAGGIGVLVLVLVATVLSVTFATRAAMATNRPVIEVLHLIGAKDNFIAGHFQRHFLQLGLKGGLIGGGSALALFALAELAERLVRRHGGGRPVRGLVRQLLDRGAGLSGGAGAGRPDRLRHRRNLAAHRQSHHRNDSLSSPPPPTCRHRTAGFCAMIAPGWTGDADGLAPTPMTAPPACLARRSDPRARRRPCCGASAGPHSCCARSAALLLGLGFLWFVWRVPADEVALDRNADGIVALTGGASRIADAIELLASGRGKRLLISGANRATNSNEISRLNPEFERWVRCCVDFDRSLNTLGNAIETKRWAESRGFRSLIVVTSNYHMPRALAEIAHQLPDVALVPFPVVTDRQRAEPWWASGARARLMFSEYVKYIFAKLRMGFNPAGGAA